MRNCRAVGRARDVKLSRDITLKVLPETLRRDDEVNALGFTLTKTKT
jgi:hypothetical protein